MLPHVVVPVAVDADVHEARAAANGVATLHGVDDGTRGRIALIVTELATNLVRHAQGGRMLIGCHAVDAGGQVEIISIDSGPGMHDIHRHVRDRQSAGERDGIGLCGVRRLSTDFSTFSERGVGTIVVSRAWAPASHSPTAASPFSRFAHAGICLAAKGQPVSGDAWDIRIADGRASVIVCDGAADGLRAADASTVAAAAFKETVGSPRTLLQRAHLLMSPTAGAAAAIAELDAKAGTIMFSGVGSIATRVISNHHDDRLPSQSGLLGKQVDALCERRAPWPDHSVLIMHSDGLRDDWTMAGSPGLLQCDPAVIAAWLVRDYANTDEDVTVVVLKRG